MSWSSYSAQGGHTTWLPCERAAAARIERMLDPGETLYALGDPTVLALTDRRNPSRFIYLGSGVAALAARKSGGNEAWGRRILASDPAVIVINAWHGPRRQP